GGLLAVKQLLQPQEAARFHLVGNLRAELRRWSAGPGAVLEGVGLREPDLSGQGESFFEFTLRLAGEPDDDVRRKCDLGLRGANPGDELEVLLSGMLTVHGREDAIGTGLERQMQIRHQLLFLAVRSD